MSALTEMYAYIESLIITSKGLKESEIKYLQKFKAQKRSSIALSLVGSIKELGGIMTDQSPNLKDNQKDPENPEVSSTLNVCIQAQSFQIMDNI